MIKGCLFGIFSDAEMDEENEDEESDLENEDEEESEPEQKPKKQNKTDKAIEEERVVFLRFHIFIFRKTEFLVLCFKRKFGICRKSLQ